MTWRQKLRAVSLWSEEEAVISHRSAAAWWRFARFKEGAIEVSLSGSHRPLEGVEIHRVHNLGRPDVWKQEGLKITSPARTLVDIARLVTPETVRANFDELLSRRRMTLDQFAGVLDRAGHPRGHQLLRAILDAYQGGELPTESELEARVYEMVVATGICPLTKQAVHWIRNRRCRIDFRVPGTNILIEALGYRWHGLWDIWETDIARINRLIVQGFRPLQWTWDAVTERPKECISDLRKLLQAVTFQPRHAANLAQAP